VVHGTVRGDSRAGRERPSAALDHAADVDDVRAFLVSWRFCGKRSEEGVSLRAFRIPAIYIFKNHQLEVVADRDLARFARLLLRSWSIRARRVIKTAAEAGHSAPQ